MRYLLTLSLVLCVSAGNAQEFRLNYDSSNLPELYNQVNIFLEQKTASGGYQKIKDKYSLSASNAQMKGSKLSFDRHSLYRDQGEVKVNAQVDGKAYPLVLNLPVINDIRFNLYTDSIKPVLNYYLNVEGVFSSGRIFPIDTNYVTLTADKGMMKGNEWILPSKKDFDRVTFTASCKYNPALQKSVTVYLKRYEDPRDKEGYGGEVNEPIIRGRRRR
jgi:hypothetical protein